MLVAKFGIFYKEDQLESELNRAECGKMGFVSFCFVLTYYFFCFNFIMGIFNHGCKPVINTKPSLMGGLEIKEESSTRACPWQEERLPVATPEKWQHPKCKESKHISFTSLSIHEYSQVLGNHPCCMLGSPLCLGWDYTEGTQVSLEEYEASRPCCRTLEAMHLSWDQRQEILTDILMEMFTVCIKS